MKKLLKQEAGITLIELLATLTIATILIAVTFNVLTTSIKYNDKTQSHINLRQEANLVVTKLRQRHDVHDGGKYDLCYGELLDNDILKLDTVSLHLEKFSNNECKQIDTSKNMEVQFTLADQQNNDFQIDTIIEAEQLKGPPISMEIQKPDREPDFGDYVREHDVFVYVNNVVGFNGSKSEIKGENSTVVIRKGLGPLSGPHGNINAKDIYIKGSVSLQKHFTLGHSNSNIYIDGDVDLNGSQINGKLTHTDKSFNSGSLDDVELVDAITFPEFEIPELKDESWYSDNGYSSEVTPGSNMRFYGSSFSTNGNRDYENAIIVSQGNVDLKGDFSGIIFAPNGKVSLRGNTTFKGIIVANEVELAAGSATIIFEPLSEDSELPF
ncbi:PulJ/GspJ family protein [Aquibacillus saliphilus]|uniref:PulJ/GspJ family protein n=1 Tax=Aquibacillus saliphilus TaxID=1909422 RepID=UPI001CEFC897|nr:prepilin-type N-terminal cleavage/methylation domain-containing protein [Aquibacillus saliphilus]